MITREKLTVPPVDIERLDRLEANVTGRARNFIQQLVNSKKLKIANIVFEFDYGKISAEASILSPGYYRIRIGRRFSNAILHFSEWSAPRLLARLNVTPDLAELEEFLYEWWMWFTLHHELSHITCGHLDFLLSHGMVRYAEICGDGDDPGSLKVDGISTKDAWWVLETEADSQAAAYALASVPLMKHCGLLRDQATFDTIAMHGTLVGLYFVLFEKLSDRGDSRHPAPAFRKVICQPSLDKLCRELGVDGARATEAMISADFDLYSKVLNLPIDLRAASEAFGWMWKMDDLLQVMNMKDFRKL